MSTTQSSNARVVARADKLIIAMGVWGDWHVDAFITLCLPSLLSTNNLPALVNMRETTFVIMTTARDRRVMEASPNWQELCDLIDVKFEILNPREIQDPIGTQQKIWSRAIQIVSDTKALLFFMPPDVVWADGSLRSIARALEAGRTILIMPWTVRVVAETFSPVMRQHFTNNPVSEGIKPRDLVRSAVDHLHPLMSAYRRDSGYFPSHPEMLLEPIARQGFLLRVTASTPSVYPPVEFTLNQNKLIVRVCRDDEIYFPADSDELFVVSLTPFVKEFHFFDQRRTADPLAIGQWWNNYHSGINDILAWKNFRIHFGELDVAQWRRTERRLDFFLRCAAIAREGLCVWHEMLKSACLHKASCILAFLIGAGLLPRVIRGPGRRLIIVPHDTAIDFSKIQNLLKFSERHRLVRFLRRFIARVVDERPIFAAADFNLCVTSDSGQPIDIIRRGGVLTVGGFRAMSPPFQAGEHIIIVIDGMFSSAIH